MTFKRQPDTRTARARKATAEYLNVMAEAAAELKKGGDQDGARAVEAVANATRNAANLRFRD